MTETGLNFNTQVNAKRPLCWALQNIIDKRAGNLLSSRTSQRGLSPLLQKGEEGDLKSDVEGETLLGQKKASMKAFPSGHLAVPSSAKATAICHYLGSFALELW